MAGMNTTRIPHKYNVSFWTSLFYNAFSIHTINTSIQLNIAKAKQTQTSFRNTHVRIIPNEQSRKTQISDFFENRIQVFLCIYKELYVSPKVSLRCFTASV